MKRYFLAHDDHLPTIKTLSGFGIVNYIPLDSHGTAGVDWNLLCMDTDHLMPDPRWMKFPSLVDSKTTLAKSDIDQQVLADLGITGEETTIEAVALFSGVHPAFGI